MPLLNYLSAVHPVTVLKQRIMDMQGGCAHTISVLVIIHSFLMVYSCIVGVLDTEHLHLSVCQSKQNE